MICHVCQETDTSSQIKAGCGHLVCICDDCRSDQSFVRHSKCSTCSGKKDPNAYLLEEQANLDEYMESRHESLDDWDWEFERERFGPEPDPYEDPIYDDDYGWDLDFPEEL